MAEDISALVVRHLVEIAAGNCSITLEDIQAREASKDLVTAEILMGLFCLHGDLVLREQQRADAVAELQVALEQLRRQNEELRQGRELAQAYVDLEMANHELNEAKKELKQTVETAMRSNAELEQFAYVASHDLREPLRMINSYLQLLKRRYGDKLDKDADEFITYAVDGANRMNVLIEDLLSYSHITTQGKPFAVVDSGAVVDKAVRNLKIAIEESSAQVTREQLPAVTADEIQLIQLFQNLIGNAIKYRSNKPPVVCVSVERKGEEWEFAVKDNGMGIDRRYYDRIFIIFQRLHAKSQYSGTGIGLAVCKKIVERHKGRLWVESEPGKGSAFYFTLPALDG